jgi:hypothetical protein
MQTQAQYRVSLRNLSRARAARKRMSRETGLARTGRESGVMARLYDNPLGAPIAAAVGINVVAAGAGAGLGALMAPTGQTLSGAWQGAKTAFGYTMLGGLVGAGFSEGGTRDVSLATTATGIVGSLLGALTDYIGTLLTPAAKTA